MSTQTKIEWCDHTFNPWIGCTKVDELCTNCYAETQDKFRAWTPKGWGKGKPRQRTSTANWRLPLRWNRDRGQTLEALKGTSFKAELERRPRVFCASLADWLDDEVPIEWLADLLALIHATPHLDWLLLTKRPENWKSRIEACAEYFGQDAFYSSNEEAGKMSVWLSKWLEGTPPCGVWIGTSAGTQKSADLRIPQLLQIPSKIRFLSCEPLLGPVNLNGINDLARNLAFSALSAGFFEPRKVDWVICGGESGAHARPMHPDWARSLRDQCAAAGVPFFFKQWGEWQPYIQGTAYMDKFSACELLANGPGATGWPMYHVGKKAAGRRLDGIEHNAFPNCVLNERRSV